MGEYIFSQTAVAVFAITGVLGAIRKDRDIVGLVALGVMTAVGGGTIRDIILNTTVFWVEDMNYIAVAVTASALFFFLLKISRIKQARYRLLLYFDALGVAYFSIQACEKTLSLGFSFPLAIIMAFLTSMGGGVMRDVITGCPNLLMTTELYVSPALLGTLLFGLLNNYFPGSSMPALISISFIFIFRSLAIHYSLRMPRWLINMRDHE